VDSLVGNAADEKQVRKAEEIERHTANQSVQDLKNVLSTEYGKRFVKRILMVTGLNDVSFRTNDPYLTAHNEGRRWVGLSILTDMIKADPQVYVNLLAEAVKETKEKKNGRDS
jgi:hypothetical protein